MIAVAAIAVVDDDDVAVSFLAVVLLMLTVPADSPADGPVG